MVQAERRRSSRINSLNLLVYTCRDSRGNILKQGTGRTINVSANGLLLETHAPLEEGQTVSLSIGFSEEMLHVTGSIVRCASRNCGTFLAGIEITEIDEASSLTLKMYIEDFRLDVEGG